MLDASWSTEQLALLILSAFIASAVICIVILTKRPQSFYYSALAGLIGGIILRLTPGGRAIAEQAEGLAAWIGQPLAGVLFALLVAALFEVLFSQRVPILRHVRPYGRRALRPWLWGTGVEIAERAHLPDWAPEMLGLGVKPSPMTPRQLMIRARVIASVLCGSCIGVFFAVPEFRGIVYSLLGAEHLAANLIATAFVTFFLGPLHDEVMQLGEEDHAPAASRDLQGRLFANLGLFAVTGVLLVLLQAIHTAIDRQIETLGLYEWILLLELCALPLVVTTFYFGAGLHRVELGEDRWSRAFEGSIFAGTIVVAPFTIIYMLVGLLTPPFRKYLVDSFQSTDHLLGLMLTNLLLLLMPIIIGMAIAVLVSAATYGVYALALAMAMMEATRADARWRAVVAVLIAGCIAQGLTSLAVWWFALNIPVLHYLHLVLALGWAGGLYVSRFHDELPEPKPAEPKPAAAPAS